MASHPFHEHNLTKVDTRRVYSFCEARWKCDSCQRHFNGTLEDETYAFHCQKCEFDLCEECHEGSLHFFHRHRLQPADPLLCYPQTDGQWRCDACMRVFSPLTEKMSWHCSKCQLDLCPDCKEGTWTHVLHRGCHHTMVPTDPRILYRCHSEWLCDHCGETKGHGSSLWTLFHCHSCDQDICLNCFSGHKHYLHHHGLIRVNCEEGGVADQPPCHVCHRKEPYYYACRIPSCQFSICQRCFTIDPPSHPLHPHHILHRTDPAQSYPQSGGVWHCDNCTNRHPHQTQTPLTSDAPMYHCDTCQYDLCETCYNNQRPRPLIANEGAALPTASNRQRHFLTVEEVCKRPSQQRPAFIPSVAPPPPAGPSICHLCGLAAARLTLKHGPSRHTRAIYCHKCAFEALKQRLACPLCGKLPDGLAEMTP